MHLYSVVFLYVPSYLIKDKGFGALETVIIFIAGVIAAAIIVKTLLATELWTITTGSKSLDKQTKKLSTRFEIHSAIGKNLNYPPYDSFNQVEKAIFYIIVIGDPVDIKKISIYFSYEDEGFADYEITQNTTLEIINKINDDNLLDQGEKARLTVFFPKNKISHTYGIAANKQFKITIEAPGIREDFFFNVPSNIGNSVELI